MCMAGEEGGKQLLAAKAEPRSPFTLRDSGARVAREYFSLISLARKMDVMGTAAGSPAKRLMQ